MKRVLWGLLLVGATLEERAGVAVSRFGTTAGNRGTILTQPADYTPVIITALLFIVLLFVIYYRILLYVEKRKSRQLQARIEDYL